MTLLPDLASKNFTWQEFSCPCCGLANVDPNAIHLLQLLRDAIGPLKINSACRCTKHNAEVGGKTGSMHLGDQGRQSTAFDISLKGIDPSVLRSKALEFGFKGIGTAKTFMHIDVRPTRADWTY